MPRVLSITSIHWSVIACARNETKQSMRIMTCTAKFIAKVAQPLGMPRTAEFKSKIMLPYVIAGSRGDSEQCMWIMTCIAKFIDKIMLPYVMACTAKFMSEIMLL
jgi:hypothetical protein